MASVVSTAIMYSADEDTDDADEEHVYVRCHFSPRVGSAVGGATEARACPH